MKLKELLAWVGNDEVFCRHLPTAGAADSAMDLRDRSAVEQAWLREDGAVKDRLAELEGHSDLELVRAIAEAASRRAFDASMQHHDLAAQVSDDMRLLAEGHLVGYRSRALESLRSIYSRGAFPTELS